MENDLIKPILNQLSYVLFIQFTVEQSFDSMVPDYTHKAYNLNYLFINININQCNSKLDTQSKMNVIK